MDITQRKALMTIRRYCLPLAGAGLIAGAVAPAAAAAPAAARIQRPGPRPGSMWLPPGWGTRPLRHLARPAGQPFLSRNWSGYAATGQVFTRVSARWVEPRVTCPGGNQYASFWVGLDGFSSSTVEQTGSETDCFGTTPQYYAWYEMFPAFPVVFSNRVRPGDHFSGSVTYRGGSAYTLVLADSTRGWRRTVTASLPGAANSSAEVVAEAPSSVSGVLPLANFGTVRFTGARANGARLGGFAPTQMIMVNDAQQFKDTVSALTLGGDFSVTWRQSS